MDGSIHTCLAGCGKRITWRFAICSKCEDKYGRSPKQWPGWLSYLWRYEQRMRRQAKKVVTYEVTEADMAPDKEGEQ